MMTGTISLILFAVLNCSCFHIIASLFKILNDIKITIELTEESGYTKMEIQLTFILLGALAITRSEGGSSRTILKARSE